MATEFRLPQLTESMATVKLSTWLKREGDTVKKGEPIAEVETDKTSVELEAPEDGVLAKIHVPAGSDKVAAGTVIATIGAAGDAVAAPAAAQAPKVEAPKPAPQAAAPQAVAPAVPAPVAAAAPTASPTPSGAKVPATALAAKMAQVAGIDLGSIPVQGRRVTKADVEAILQSRGIGTRTQPVAAPVAAVPVFPVPAIGVFEDKPATAMRRVTAQRLQQSKQSIPHFYLQTNCRVDRLLALRQQINASGAVKITVTDLLVAAVGLAIRRVPAVNSAWLGDGVRVYQSVDIAVAVATPQGLITPVVRGCEQKPVAAISRDLKDLSERARNGKLKPEEYTNATFTISNLGMYGVTNITPILNPPQCCILGVGATEAVPVVEDGTLVPGHVMGLTLAADHRAIDGVTGAEFMQQLRKLIEDPIAIALGL
ncbi:MAG: dihydrolipoamide acetyltransferase family protein [Vicinamibacterales bacterium]|nr:dihydrolipoamide acetyltransferase family protein [Vicinamibacterales bacterium]